MRLNRSRLDGLHQKGVGEHEKEARASAVREKDPIGKKGKVDSLFAGRKR